MCSFFCWPSWTMEHESLGLSNSFCEIMNCSYIFPDVGLALITDKSLSLQRAWPLHAWWQKRSYPIWYKINDVWMTYAAYTLCDPITNGILWGENYIFKSNFGLAIFSWQIRIVIESYKEYKSEYQKIKCFHLQCGHANNTWHFITHHHTRVPAL